MTDIDSMVQQILSTAQKSASIHTMTCASYAEGIWCVFQGQIHRAIQKLRNAISLALLSCTSSIWVRAFEYLTVLLIRSGKHTEAQKMIELLCSLQRVNRLDCTESMLARWLLTGEPIQGEIPKEAQDRVLYRVYLRLQHHNQEDVLRLFSEKSNHFHPFVGLFVERMGDDILPQAKRIALVKQISIC